MVTIVYFPLQWKNSIKTIVEDAVEEFVPFWNHERCNINSDSTTVGITKTLSIPFHGLAALGRTKMMGYGLTERIKEVYSWRWRCGSWLVRQDSEIIAAVRLLPPHSFTFYVHEVYSGLTVTLLAEHSHLPAIISIVYCTICSLALASHAKCMFTDPGAIPSSAVPPAEVQRTISVHAMCSHCETYKPPGAHHCRICNRCISHMDHHCPWMNNCVRHWWASGGSVAITLYLLAVCSLWFLYIYLTCIIHVGWGRESKWVHL
jgi:hypothetical protein